MIPNRAQLEKNAVSYFILRNVDLMGPGASSIEIGHPAPTRCQPHPRDASRRRALNIGEAQASAARSQAQQQYVLDLSVRVVCSVV